MASAVLKFTVDDSSSTIEYSPIADTFGSPNLSAGWNPHWDIPGFSSANLGAVGSGQSLHITSLNGASLQIQWTGTGIELFGNATNSSYDITIDDQAMDTSSSANVTAGVLFSVDTLNEGDHALSLTVQANGPESLFEFDSATIAALPSPSNVSNLTFTQQVLNDTFAFVGKWSFLNDSDSSHQSTTAGDSASIQFTGTAFQLLGSTSPQAGNYSVTLDNVTTSFSARSSFSQADSLLFFASGLDAETTHHLNITNTGGATLVLPTGGAIVWALSDTSTGASSSSSPSSSPSVALSQKTSGLSSGTIAALVLAGVLIFFVAICVVLYFFLYRPYRRRQLLRRQQAKEHPDQDFESVLVVDIAPEEPTKKAFYHDITAAGPSRDRTSKRTGFAKWKEEVEGGLGSWGRGALGIAFRHSDSTGRRDASRSDVEYDLGATSDGYKSTSSSSNGEYPDQRKGKARERSGRWPRRSRDKSLSPKFKLDLPLQPRSRSGSHSAQSNALSSDQQDPSVISSLSYLSSPSLHPTTLPPSPRRPSPQPNTHSRMGSEGALLIHADELHHPPEPEDDSRPPLPPVPPPKPQPPPPDPRNDDRGSVREYDADDSHSILGDGSARIALRSLSPRTAETDHRTRPKRRAKKDKQMTSSPLAQPSTPVDTSTSHRAEAPDSLSLRVTSPFQVDFDQADRRASRVHFDDAPSVQASESQGGDPPVPDDSRRRPTQSAPSRPSDHLRNVSFLDFASSSEGSIISRSNDYSSSSRSFGSPSAVGRSHWSTGGSSNIASLVPPPQPQSRWSATTTPGSELQPDSNSSSDSNFPFPVSLPPSPHHPEGTFMPPPLTFVTQLSGTPLRGSAMSSLNAHPSDLITSIPTSPTESDVPMSISDIHFRQSDSDEQTGNGSHLPAHPPLPPTPSQAQAPEEISYIVQRVVGSTPSLGNTLTPTPTMTRFNTSPVVGTSPGSSSSPGRGL
ncbi:hypothetical protein C8R45DRAFT_1210836 [Mycena sanguinolenta]|nr:hypothetical protein C8R45DRAFT_1210836 [Mycena sanguinolenta]